MDEQEFLNQMEMMGGWNMDAVQEIPDHVPAHNLRRVLRAAENMGEDKDTDNLLYRVQMGEFSE